MRLQPHSEAVSGVRNRGLACVDADELVRTYDCATAACRGDARETGGLCQDCETALRRGLVPGSLEAMAGRAFDDSRFGGAENLMSAVPDPRGSGALTERERDVIECLADGRPDDWIAEELSVSPHTVKTHVRNILRKLGARNRTHAIVLAVRQGVVAL